MADGGDEKPDEKTASEIKTMHGWLIVKVRWGGDLVGQYLWDGYEPFGASNEYVFCRKKVGHNE